MKIEDVPAELLEILDRHAGKLYDHPGAAAFALAEILTAYEALRPSYFMYVIVGAAARPEINTDTAFREVHRSNMTKILLDGSCIARADGKILKPLTYQEADMTKAVK
jgi:predicted HAD superfamily Cof-like phosphohydrolase